MIFVPKPPPTSGAITSTWNSGRPNMRASPFLMGSGACVDVPHAQDAGAVVLGHDAARLDGAPAAPLDDEALAEDVGARAEGRVGIADALRRSARRGCRDVGVHQRARPAASARSAGR